MKKIKYYMALFKRNNFLNPIDFFSLKFIKNKYFKGRGLEIGPGDFPYSQQNTTYIDKFPKHYDLNKSKKVIKVDNDQIPFGNSTFDFLISAHCLEHCPDTIKTLKEWIRVVKKEGLLFIILPHCDRTFDKGRKYSTLEHHIKDYKNKVDIYDQDPLIEWENISLKNAKPKWLLDENSRNVDGSLNFKWMAENGLIHYHSWTQNELLDIGKYLNLKVRYSSEYFPTRKDSFVVIFEK